MGAAKAGAGLLKGGASVAANALKTGAGGPEQLLQQLMAGHTAQPGPAMPAQPMAPAPTSGAATNPADPSVGYKPGSPLFSGGPAAIPTSLLPTKPSDVSQPVPQTTAQRQIDPNQPDHHIRDRWVALLMGGPRGLLDEMDRQRLAQALRGREPQG